MVDPRIALTGLLLLAACTPKPPAPDPAPSPTAKLEPAPIPHGGTIRRGPTNVLEMPIPPKMPIGTGAVPVSSSPVRGSVTTGYRGAF